MRHCTIDLETSVDNVGDFSIGKFKASPYHPDNQIVALGYKYNGSSCRTLYYTDNDITGFCCDSDVLLVGQNIKFDLLYLMRYEHWREWLWTGKIWCCALAEYILTGQESKYADLDSLSLKYGGTVKPDAIKEYWDAGIRTEDIPKSELLDYLEGDVNNTETVFLKQAQEAHSRGLLPLIMMEMEALLATTEMEYNGLPFDKEGAAKKASSLQTDLFLLENSIAVEMHHYLPELDATAVMPSSNDQLSAVLFGGTYKYDGVEQVLDTETGEPYVFKTGKKKGQVKTRKVVVEAKTDGMGIEPQEEWATKKAGVYQTNESVLKSIKIDFTKKLLEYRGLAKDINTYYIGYGNLVWHDGCIHGKIDHVGTNTARFNSSSPNLMNLSNKE